MTWQAFDETGSQAIKATAGAITEEASDNIRMWRPQCTCMAEPLFPEETAFEILTESVTDLGMHECSVTVVELN